MNALMPSHTDQRPNAADAWTRLVHQSVGTDGRTLLSDETKAWLGDLTDQLPKQFWIHHDAPARAAANAIGAAAFVEGNHIYLADIPAQHREAVLRHELVHIAQATLIGTPSSPADAEQEAHRLSRLPIATAARCPADPARVYPFFWFIIIGVAALMLIDASPANAPGLHDRPLPSNDGKLLVDILCLLIIPGGAFALAGRVGLGFLASSAVAGAAGNVSLRGAHDLEQGKASPPLMYLTDAGTGAIIGFIVPGGFRLIGKAGTFTLDQLATHGMTQSDIALTKVLAERAAQTPLSAAEAQQVLASRGLFGKVSKAYLDRRGVFILYRGQLIPTQQILSPLAREQGVAASQNLINRLRSIGIADADIAGFTAKFHDEPVPPFGAPAGLAGQRLGAGGIPTTTLPGIAAHFGPEGVIYTIRMPKTGAIVPNGWGGLTAENEVIIFNQVPKDSIVHMFPAKRVAPLTVDENGLLAPGH